jgi:DNA-directed RNA polymerase specialized sigma24 family protein
MRTKVTDPEALLKSIPSDLINGCKDGDIKAQFQVYKIFYKTMYNTSLRIVNDTAEAEDIMQESFLTAFEKIGSWSDSENFAMWLKEIVVNRSINFVRK